MKSVWKGALSFGLVTIDVELYSAIQSHVLGFKLLHSECNTPINYQYWCESCKKQVKWENIVKGLPLTGGSFFIVTPEQIKKLRPQKTDAISVVEFVDDRLVEPIYYNNHYYLAPNSKGKATHKAFRLFVVSLSELKKIAIGIFVMRDKQYTCAIRSYNDGLLLSTLNYGYEIREAPVAETMKKVNKDELTLAKELIQKLTKKKFNIDHFKDTFAQELKKELQRARKGKIKRVATTKKPTITHKEKTPSLIAALRASLHHPAVADHTSAARR